MKVEWTSYVTRAFSPCRGRKPLARRARAKSPCHVGAAVLLVLFFIQAALAQPTTAPTVGMEGQLQLHLPGTALQAKPVDEKAPLILRISSATVGPNGGFYDLRYIGMVPGQYDLKAYLARLDGSTMDDLQAISVSVSPLLPEDHTGQLLRAPGAAWPFFGGYRNAMIAIVAAWVVLLIPLMLWGRKRRLAQTQVEQTRAETFADRLRPYIEHAAAGGLSDDEKGALERLLLSHWQRRLNLMELDPSEAITHLRRDPQAGELLRKLEDWLHRPPQTQRASVDLADLLSPYRDAPQGVNA